MPMYRLLPKNLPAWSAPFIGWVAGIFTYMIGLRRSNDEFRWEMFSIFAGIGLVAGVIIMLVDRRPKRESLPGSGITKEEPQSERLALRQSLSILALLVCWAPIVNLGVAFPAWFFNRKVRGWPRILSLVCLVIGAVWTTVCLGVIYFEDVLAE